MNWFKKNPLFSTALLVLALIILAQIALIFLHRGNLADARQELQNVQSERERLLSREPTPTSENAANVEEELEAHREWLGSLKELFADPQVVEEFFGDAPTDSTQQAFFELDRWRNRTIQRFAAEGMLRRPDDVNLGFQQHSESVPSNLIETVHRQRVIAEFLLNELFEANPESLVRVNRQNPDRFDVDEDETTTRFRRPQARGTREDGDFFDMPALLTLYRPGEISTEGFRIVFTGQTETLRNYLSALQESEYPIFIRNVDVQPVDTRDRSRARSDDTEELARQLGLDDDEDGPTGGGQIDVSVLEDLDAEERERLRPIIGNVVNRFAVTIEFVTLQDSDNSEDDPNL